MQCLWISTFIEKGSSNLTNDCATKHEQGVLPMNDFNTNLMSVLFKDESVDNLIRRELENTINLLLKWDLTVFLDYEKHDPVGYNSGNSRNGTYNRKLNTCFDEITVDVHRDRLGEFKQRTVPSYKRSTDDLESMIIQLYRKGI
jgi:putative transposase